MEKFPRKEIPAQSSLRKSYQKLEIEDGERPPTFWSRIRHRLARKKKTGVQEKKDMAKGPS
jgi:hypothetical protein